MIDDKDKESEGGASSDNTTPPEGESKADLQARDKRKSRKAPKIEDSESAPKDWDAQDKTDQPPLPPEASEPLSEAVHSGERPKDNVSPPPAVTEDPSEIEQANPDANAETNAPKESETTAAKHAPANQVEPPKKPKPSLLKNLQKDTQDLAQLISNLTDSKSQIHKDISQKKNRVRIFMLMLLQKALIKSALFRKIFKFFYSVFSFFYNIFKAAKGFFTFLFVLSIMGLIFYTTYNYFLDVQRRRTQVNQHISTNLDKVTKYFAEGDDQEKLAPFQRAQVAIILTDVGMLPEVAETAIQKLPQEVTLAFNANAPGLNKWVHLSRIAGHDTMIVVPFEPSFYPFYDPGPETLLTGRPEGENIQKLESLLKRTNGIVGVVNTVGFRFSNSESDLAPVMRMLGARDLIYLDSHLTGGDVYAKLAAQHRVRTIRIDAYLNDVPNPQKITEILDLTTKIAKKNGFATILVDGAPQYVDYIQAWLNNLKKENIQIVRISNLAAITSDVDSLLSKMPTEEEQQKRLTPSKPPHAPAA